MFGICLANSTNLWLRFLANCGSADGNPPKPVPSQRLCENFYNQSINENKAAERRPRATGEFWWKNLHIQSSGKLLIQWLMDFIEKPCVKRKSLIDDVIPGQQSVRCRDQYLIHTPRSSANWQWNHVFVRFKGMSACLSRLFPNLFTQIYVANLIQDLILCLSWNFYSTSAVIIKMFRVPMAMPGEVFRTNFPCMF